MRCAASSAVSGWPSKVSTVNMRPFERLPLWGMARTSVPVSVLEVLHEGPEVFGVLAVVLREGQRLVGDAGVAAEEHVAVQVVAADRGPLEADDRGEGAGIVVAIGECGVGLPGVADRGLALDRRRSPESEPTISIAVAKTRSRSPLVSAPYQRCPASVASTSGSPLSSCGIRPYISAWSEITRKSNGRPSLARRPPVETTSSPRAKR